MKKIGYVYFLWLLMVMSCTKQDFQGERPDKKLAELRNEYIQTLSNAKHGWIAYLFPKGGRGFTFKFKFDAENRVKSLATVERDYAVQEIESSYRIEMDQTPSLVFDTYSYLHLLSDPDDLISGGRPGLGMQSDFEFSILKVHQDTIRLLGNHNESELILVRASEQQGDDFIQKAFMVDDQISNFNQSVLYYKKVKINNKDYTLSLNQMINTVSINSYENGLFRMQLSDYVLTDNGIKLKKAFRLGDLQIEELNNILFNKSQGKGSFLINKSEKIQIETIDKPLFIDKEAPRVMHRERKSYFSHTGFTINGQYDALGMKNLPSFVGVLFVPRVTLDNLDGSYVVYYAGERYVGPAFNTVFRNDGKFTFIPFELLTGYNPGEENIARVKEFIRLWFLEGGYYVIQTGAKSYDLVSVADSKIWLRFN